MKTMNELMLHFLQDIYDAERRSVRAMQKLIRAAQSEELKTVVGEHRAQSDRQIERLDNVFEVLNKRPRGRACRAMIGLAEELDEAIAEGQRGPVLDAALIAAAQAVEHYEMARYGALLAWAKQTGMSEAADLLQETLDEEKQAEQRLSELATGSVNAEAAENSPEPAPSEPEPEPRRGRRPAAAKATTPKASMPAEKAAKPAPRARKPAEAPTPVAPPPPTPAPRGRPKRK